MMPRAHWAVATTLALAALSPMVAAAQAVPEDIRASGNEPFWSVEVTAGKLTLRRPGEIDTVLSVVGRTDAADGSTVIRAASASPALDLVLTLRPGACADTMADQTFPFAADLVLGETMLSGCGGEPRDLLTQVETWTVTGFAGAAPLEGTEVSISFTEENRLAGTAGCNRFMGGYTLTGEGLSIGPLASTMMACPDPVMAQERQVLALLEQVVSFSIREDGGLTLVTRDGARIDAAAP
jgi:heat shock protein HslJ